MKCIVKKIIMRKINQLLKNYEKNVDSVSGIIKTWTEKLTVITTLLESAMDKIEDKELTDEEVGEILSELEAAIDAIVKKK